MADHYQSIRLQRVEEPKIRLRVMPRVPPLEIEMQNTGTEIQWRVGTTGTWATLIEIDDIDASISIGSVTTLPAGDPATVVNSGTAQDVVLDFGIPAGEDGTDGVMASVVAGQGIAVDSTDPAHPIVTVDAVASEIPFTPTGGVAATNVQTAIAELDTEKLSAVAAAAAYQPLSSGLTSWAGVTRATGFDAFAATPSSALLRALLTDEVGTGAAYFVGGALGTPASVTLTNATGLTTAGIAAATLVTASETIGSNNNDTTIPTSAAVKAYADSLAVGGQPVPTSSTFAVGTLLFVRNNAGGSIADGGTIAGSSLQTAYANSGGALVTGGGAQTGTWTNRSGRAITSSEFGYFARTA